MRPVGRGDLTAPKVVQAPEVRGGEVTRPEPVVVESSADGGDVPANDLHESATGLGAAVAAGGRAGEVKERPADLVQAALGLAQVALRQAGVPAVHRRAGKRRMGHVGPDGPDGQGGSGATRPRGAGPTPDSVAKAGSVAPPERDGPATGAGHRSLAVSGRGRRRGGGTIVRSDRSAALPMIGQRAAGVPPRVVAGLADGRMRARRVDQVTEVPALEEPSEGSPTVSEQVAERRTDVHRVAERRVAERRTDVHRVVERRDPGGSGSQSPASTAPGGGVSPAVVLPRYGVRAPGGRPTVVLRPSGV